jgi:hypothetical protein
MNYFEVNNLIKRAFMAHPFVGNVYSDVYKDDHTENIEYPCVVYNVQNVSVNSDNTQSLQMIVYYIDRLTAEEDNAIQVQSTGISTITEVMNALQGVDDVDVDGALPFTPFKGQFADNCAGVYCNLTMVYVTDMGTCYELCS